MDGPKVIRRPQGHRALVALVRGMAVLGVAALSAGCMSFSYVDSENRQHILGLVDLRIEPSKRPSDPTVLKVTSLGLHVYSGTANGGGVVVGYASETMVAVPNNGCVDLRTPGACASARSASTTGNQGEQPGT